MARPRGFARPEGVWVDPPAWRQRTAFARIRPSFLVIGAQRSGSTTLFRHLSAHPRILPPLRKEIHYFDFQYEKGPSWYLAHYPGVHHRLAGAGKARPVTFEASPYYMVHPLAPARVKAYDPRMKLVAILRDPVDRALSHYHHESRRGVETLTFEEAIAAEPERLRGAARLLQRSPHYSHCHHHFSYLDRGRYGYYLERWLEHFPRQQLLVLRSEDLFQDADAAVNAVYAFLGLPAHRLASNAAPAKPYQPMPPDLRQRLAQHFAPDQARLHAMLNVPKAAARSTSGRDEADNRRRD